MTSPIPCARHRTHLTLRHPVRHDTDLADLETATQMPDEVIAFHARRLFKNLRRGLKPDTIREMLHEVLARHPDRCAR